MESDLDRLCDDFAQFGGGVDISLVELNKRKTKIESQLEEGEKYRDLMKANKDCWVCWWCGEEFTIKEKSKMAHCCPNCKEAAPVLFRFCPQCDFDMKDCVENGCNHSPKTMGEKYLIETGECLGCGEKLGVCDCYK